MAAELYKIENSTGWFFDSLYSILINLIIVLFAFKELSIKY